MTTHEFDASTSSPRHGGAVAKRSRAPVEPLSLRMRRLRIARGYSIYELATEAQIFAGTIRHIESGRPADKRALAPLAAALRVPLCRLICGEHDCSQRACVPQAPLQPAPEPSRCGRAISTLIILRSRGLAASPPGWSIMAGRLTGRAAARHGVKRVDSDGRERDHRGCRPDGSDVGGGVGIGERRCRRRRAAR